MHERVMLLVRDLQPLERLFTLTKGDIRSATNIANPRFVGSSIEASTFLASTSLRADAYVCASWPLKIGFPATARSCFSMAYL